MGRVRKFAQKYIYIFSFLLAVIAICLLYICNFWIFKSGKGLDYNLNRVYAHTVPLIFVVFVCLLFKYSNRVKLHNKGIVTGILFGWLFIADGLYGFVSSYISFNKSNTSFPSIQKILFFTLVMFLVGMFEEILYRGIILNNMLDKWGSTKTGMIKAVILSSLIFGLGHLVNLLGGFQAPITTITQVIYTFLNGILFACIYIRCKNIWAVIILHAVDDWLCLVSSIYHTVTISTVSIDSSITSMLITSITYIPFALFGFFLLRKVLVKGKLGYEIDTKSV